MGCGAGQDLRGEDPGAPAGGIQPLVAVILAVSIAVKLYMSHYNRAIGRKIGSAAMAATAADSLSDSLATPAVLLSTLAGHFWNVNIDGWCGAAVACFICGPGSRPPRRPSTPCWASRPSPEFVSQIQEIVLRHRENHRHHELMVHDYGPGAALRLPPQPRSPPPGTSWPSTTWWTRRSGNWPQSWGALPPSTWTRWSATTGSPPRPGSGWPPSSGSSTRASPSTTSAWSPGPTHTNVIFDAVVPYGCPLSDQEVARRVQEGVRALDGNYFAVVEVEKSYV